MAPPMVHLMVRVRSTGFSTRLTRHSVDREMSMDSTRNFLFQFQPLRRTSYGLRCLRRWQPQTWPDSTGCTHKCSLEFPPLLPPRSPLSSGLYPGALHCVDISSRTKAGAPLATTADSTYSSLAVCRLLTILFCNVQHTRHGLSGACDERRAISQRPYCWPGRRARQR